MGWLRPCGLDFFFFSSRRRHTRYWRDWSSDVCSSDLGTTNFLHGYPAYAVSIAALVDDVLTAAVVMNVPTGDVFTAVVDGGAYRNDEIGRASCRERV